MFINIIHCNKMVKNKILGWSRARVKDYVKSVGCPEHYPPSCANYKTKINSIPKI